MSAAASATGPIGIFGGTFDPIHLGHLRSALEVLEKLALAEVRFVPCREPPHRDPPRRTAQLRLQMVRAAIAGEGRFCVDERELARAGPSYTIDTLGALREEHPGRSLCLLLGMDAFLDLPGWHRWTELLDVAHIVVAHRPGWVPPRDGPVGELLDEHGSDEPSSVREAPAGRVVVTPVTRLEISSTALRAAIAHGGDPRYLVPEPVRELIRRSGAYA